MKMKMRDLVIAIMLIVMAAALSVTLISCGSDKTAESGADKKVTETITEAANEVDEADDSGDTIKKASDKPVKKSDVDKNTSAKSGKSGKSEKSSVKSESAKKETTKATEPATQPTTKAPDVCYITIEGFCSGKAITLQGGDTVYSILCRSGASVSGSGHYVKGINGKYEFDEGPTSGWTYYVNGSKPGVGCGSYSVNAGDNITWDYVTSY